MSLWILIGLITAACCAALVFAARARPDASATDAGAVADRSHQRSLLGEIETDLSAGRISESDANAAKAELAREVLRTEREHAPRPAVAPGFSRLPIGAALLAGLLGLAVYAMIGSPQLPSAPLAGRDMPQQSQLSLEDAVARVEAQLQKTPDDVRGWRVIAPIYMQTGRYDDAVGAFRRILALAPPDADSVTDLAEALMLQNGGNATSEASNLLEQAQDLQPGHVRSRFFRASVAMQQEDFAAAIADWQALIDAANGDEPWLPIARRGLEMAESGTNAPPAAASGSQSASDPSQGSQQEMIRSMVEGLDARLASGGGSLAEWMQLVRARLVLGERDKAQLAYDAARAAYPDPAERAELDKFANENGLAVD